MSERSFFFNEELAMIVTPTVVPEIADETGEPCLEVYDMPGIQQMPERLRNCPNTPNAPDTSNTPNTRTRLLLCPACRPPCWVGWQELFPHTLIRSTTSYPQALRSSVGCLSDIILVAGRCSVIYALLSVVCSPNSKSWNLITRRSEPSTSPDSAPAQNVSSIGARVRLGIRSGAQLHDSRISPIADESEFEYQHPPMRSSPFGCMACYTP